MMTSEQIIDGLGGTGAVADRLRLSQNTVSNWKRRGIPWRYRPAIAAMASAASIDLPAGFLRIADGEAA